MDNNEEDRAGTDGCISTRKNRYKDDHDNPSLQDQYRKASDNVRLNLHL